MEAMRRSWCPLGLAPVLLLACGGGAHRDAAAATCPDDIPSACALPAPSYVADVAPIVAQRCGSCHGLGGVEYPAVDLSTHAAFVRQQHSVLSVLATCRMPQAGSPQLQAAQRATLLNYLVCGAPEP